MSLQTSQAFFCVLTMLTSLASWAQNENTARRMTAFYRSPSSPVSSGKETLGLLAKYQVQRYRQTQLKIETLSKQNAQFYNVEFDAVATDLHVSEWALTQNETSLYTGPLEKHKLQKRLLSNEHVQILAFNKEWVEVYVPQMKIVGHLRWLDLKSNYFDHGLFYLILKSPLKSKPDSRAHTLNMLPAGLRFKIVGRSNGWLELEYKGQRGFLSNNGVLTKFDFAISVSNEKNQWTAYKTDSLKSENSKAFTNRKITAIYTDSNRAIVVRKKEFLNLHQTVKLHRENETVWVQSQIPEHGLVWWQLDSESSTIESPSNNSLSTKKIAAINSNLEIADLLRRSIYSVSLHPKNDKIGLVSAEGIFYSTDGAHWKKLEYFENQNHPVHIHSDGSLFVGSYRSTDQGKTFSEVMQWEKITRIVEAALTKPPQFLKLLSFSSIATSSTKNALEMVLDTGYKKVRLVSSTSGESWLYKK